MNIAIVGDRKGNKEVLKKIMEDTPNCVEAVEEKQVNLEKICDSIIDISDSNSNRVDLGLSQNSKKLFKRRKDFLKK